MNFTVKGHRVHVSNGGREINYREPAVLLLHGAGMNSTVWQLQTRWLAYKKFLVFAIDLPGHGQSEGKPLNKINAMADWLVCFLDTVNICQSAIIGHSMGGLIALDLASRYPSRVNALGLLGVSAQMPVNSVLLAAAKFNKKIAAELICDWGYSNRFHIGGNSAIGIWAIELGKKILEHASPGVLYSDLKACTAYQDAQVAAANISCPTLFLLGDEDKMACVEGAKKLMQEINNAEICVLKEVGHMLMSEAPYETNKVLLNIL